VPFFIRTGKRLPATQTEFRMIFKRPPRLGLQRLGQRAPEPNQLVVRLDPSAGVRLELDARPPVTEQPELMPLQRGLGREGGDAPTPYEVLLHAALMGDSTRFARQDGVEQQWRIMQPLLDTPPPVHSYPPGSWGPAAADTLVAGSGRWQEPWVES